MLSSTAQGKSDYDEFDFDDERASRAQAPSLSSVVTRAISQYNTNGATNTASRAARLTYVPQSLSSSHVHESERPQIYTQTSYTSDTSQNGTNRYSQLPRDAHAEHDLPTPSPISDSGIVLLQSASPRESAPAHSSYDYEYNRPGTGHDYEHEYETEKRSVYGHVHAMESQWVAPLKTYT